MCLDRYYAAILTMFRSRWPYIILTPISFLCLYGLMKASSYEIIGSSSVKTVGLFFYNGVVASECSSPITRKTYFLLHLTMAFFLSIICIANRRGKWTLIRRIFHFSWAYLAVGIAIPLQLLFTGDAYLFDSERIDDDANYDTWCVLFINIGWFFLSFFPGTTCQEVRFARSSSSSYKDHVTIDCSRPLSDPTQEYAVPASVTKFDAGTIVWAGAAMIPLILYSYRSRLPRLWTACGFDDRDGRGYLALAWLNSFLVIAFAARETLLVSDDRRTDFFEALLPEQRKQYDWHIFTAVVDYVLTAVTLAVLASRSEPRPGILLTALVLLLPPVGFPIFMWTIRRDRVKKR